MLHRVAGMKHCDLRPTARGRRDQLLGHHVFFSSSLHMAPRLMSSMSTPKVNGIERIWESSPRPDLQGVLP
jgi:hypothetical protein